MASRRRRREVVDTVGAGDSFMAAMLAVLVRVGRRGRRRGRAGGARRRPRRAAGARRRRRPPAVTCSRRGANPPTRRELPPTWPAGPTGVAGRPAGLVGRQRLGHDVEHDRVEGHAEVAGAHLHGRGLRVQAAAPVDDAVAAGEHRGEARRPRASGTRDCSQLARAHSPDGAVLAHQSCRDRRRCSRVSILSVEEQDRVGRAGRQDRAAERDDAVDRGRAGGRPGRGPSGRRGCARRSVTLRPRRDRDRLDAALERSEASWVQPTLAWIVRAVGAVAQPAQRARHQREAAVAGHEAGHQHHRRRARARGPRRAYGASRRCRRSSGAAADEAGGLGDGAALAGDGAQPGGPGEPRRAEEGAERRCP